MDTTGLPIDNPTASAVAPIANCEDCGLPYGGFPLDVVLPDADWLRIHPDGCNGLLCARCIVLRASKLPRSIVVYARLVEADDHDRFAALKDVPWSDLASVSKTAGSEVVVSVDAAARLWRLASRACQVSGLAARQVEGLCHLFHLAFTEGWLSAKAAQSPEAGRVTTVDDGREAQPAPETIKSLESPQSPPEDRPPHAPQEWKPIETAPKDGRAVLLFPSRCWVEECDRGEVAYWIDAEWVAQGPTADDWTGYTHWQPLPVPPEQTAP